MVKHFRNTSEYFLEGYKVTKWEKKRGRASLLPVLEFIVSLTSVMCCVRVIIINYLAKSQMLIYYL